MLTGQKIGDTEAFVSAPVHASLSGEVTEISTVINPSTGQPIEAIVISSDGADRWVELHPASNPESLPKEEILKRVREVGIVGLGGAFGFVLVMAIMAGIREKMALADPPVNMKGLPVAFFVAMMLGLAFLGFGSIA